MVGPAPPPLGIASQVVDQTNGKRPRSSMAARRRSEGQDVSCRGALAERAHDVLVERALAAGAVKPFSDDDEDPPAPAPLLIANEPEYFAVGFRRGHPVEVTLRLDVEPRVRQCIEDARVGLLASAENRPVALTLDPK